MTKKCSHCGSRDLIETFDDMVHCSYCGTHWYADDLDEDELEESEDAVPEHVADAEAAKDFDDDALIREYREIAAERKRKQEEKRKQQNAAIANALKTSKKGPRR